jgi:threonine/homoserine/homoserine lactone efflux protein
MIDPFPFATYSFVMSITPGPNNVMLTASGANYGFRRTVPHLLGVTIGHTAQTVAVCAGLGAIFLRWPALQTALQWIGAIYLVYMGWRLLGSGDPRNAATGARPITFFEAAAFQLLNPKAWVMSLTAASLFMPRELGLIGGCIYVATMMLLINWPCVTVWALFGSSLRNYLQQPARRLAFNAAMALALAGTAVIMVV